MIAPEADPAVGRQRVCGYCGAPLTPEQDWCLNCGAAVTTRIVRPPNWRAPLVAMAGVLLVAVAALIVSFFALSDDDGTQATTPTPTPAPQVTPTPTPVPGAAPESTPTPTPTPATAPEGTPTPIPVESEPDSWPQGQRAWTLVMHTGPSEATAQQRAQQLADQGLQVGVLRSDDFESLPPGRWIVFSGQYDDAAAARSARQELGDVARDASVLEVIPR